MFFNNKFENDVNVRMGDGAKVDAWSKSSLVKGTNIIGGGPYIGGNYWATPVGDGFSQTHHDNNSDGIAEEAYNINSGYRMRTEVTLSKQVPISLLIISLW
ncbi:NosD domain-containing protein [Methanosarcina horonobensis]|uniref:NosD domain-containing protein n=2 Tax=Methanosarcina horonobensis TaxID=418008 RepID=UPI00064ECB23|nr:NosD domain-containing protein [Methanosarcina horonobensis]